MQFKSILSFIILALCVSTVAAQPDLQITKKITRTMPGMEQMATAELPPAFAKQIQELSNPVSTV